MRLKDKLTIVNKNLSNKYNIFLIIFMILVFSGMFVVLTVNNYVTEYINYTINNNIAYRQIIILNSSKSDDYDFTSIEHVEAVISNKYMGDSYTYISDLDTGTLDGYIYLQPVYTENDIVTSSGIELDPEGSGYVICPEEFYPDSSYTLSGVVDYFSILDGSDYIGFKFNLESIDKEMEIIDTYDSNAYANSKNVCYISYADFRELKDKNSSNSTGIFLQVDDIANTDEVVETLTSLGYEYMFVGVFEMSEIDPILNTTSFIALLLSIIFILVITFIIVKKNKKNKSYYGMLSSLGYTSKNITSISNLEVLIVSILSSLMALIILFVLYLMAKYFILTYWFIENSNYYPPFILLICLSILLIFIISIVNRIATVLALKDR